MRADFQELAAFLAEEETGEPIPREFNYLWEPSLSPTQRKIYDEKARFILVHGEKGSGKTHCIVHKMVSHAFNNPNATALFVTPVKTQALTGGLWELLSLSVLPEWQAGRRAHYTDEKQDSQTKNPFRFIQNRHEGWSKLMLISAPFPELLEVRIRGVIPSAVYVDELTSTESPKYFSSFAQQLRRHPAVPLEEQQFIGACNPAGKKHWVYKRFLEMPLDTKTGEWNREYRVFHLSKEENINNPESCISTDYFDTQLQEAFADDPIMLRRMRDGEWVDRPSGKAIYSGYFFPNLHVFGDSDKWLMPHKDYPVMIGYDLGGVNHGIAFLQEIPTKTKLKWIQFDEIVYTNKKIRYDMLVPQIMKRMQYWNERAGTEFVYQHISDTSSFNQFRPHGESSYDVDEVERLSREMAHQYKGVRPIRMMPSPKFSGSVEARVKILMNKLTQEEYVVSAKCVRTIEMLAGLERANRGKPGAASSDNEEVYYFTPQPGSPHRHIHDAVTYPMILHRIKRGGGRMKSGGSDVKISALGGK